MARGYLELPAGEYSVEVRTEEHGEVRESAVIEMGERRELSFTVGAPSDGTILLEFPYSVRDAEVYVNGKSAGRNADTLTGLRRGENRIEIRSGSFDNVISETVTLEGDSPIAAFSIRLDGRTGSILRVE